MTSKFFEIVTETENFFFSINSILNVLNQVDGVKVSVKGFGTVPVNNSYDEIKTFIMSSDGGLLTLRHQPPVTDNEVS